MLCTFKEVNELPNMSDTCILREKNVVVIY